jgi:hypothetical protein
MAANPRISVGIPTPSITVMHSRQGDLRPMTARNVIQFAEDLAEAIDAGLDPDAKIEWLKSGEYSQIYGARVSSKIKRQGTPT